MLSNQRRGCANITPGGVPSFLVRYVGKTETYAAYGKGCTVNAVQKIWDNSEEEKKMKRWTMLISPEGIELVENPESKIRDKDRAKMKFDIRYIAHCCAEKTPHERVFTWISQNTRTQTLECHAVLSSREKSQLMAATLHRAFYIAYRNWKGARERKTRLKKASKAEEKTKHDIVHAELTHMAAASFSGDTSREKMRGGSPHEYSCDLSPAQVIDSSDSEESDNPFLESAMAEMNIVEEDYVHNHTELAPRPR